MEAPGHVYRAARDLTAGRGRDRFRSMYTEVAAMLTARRVDLGLSQGELAARLGTTQSAIARLEQGWRPPRFDTLLAMAEALECDFEIRLVTRDGEGDEPR